MGLLFLVKLYETIKKARPEAESAGEGSELSVDTKGHTELQLSWAAIGAIIAVIVSSCWAVIRFSL